MPQIASSIIVAVIVFLLGGASGWYITSNSKDVEIATLKKDKAEAEAKTSTEALTEFKSQADIIRQAAQESQLGISQLQKSFDVLKKERKNAKPLPVDCKPDDGRMRNLQSAIQATNNSISGH